LILFEVVHRRGGGRKMRVREGNTEVSNNVRSCFSKRGSTRTIGRTFESYKGGRKQK